jgi:hypothetical protein
VTSTPPGLDRRSLVQSKRDLGRVQLGDSNLALTRGDGSV